MVFFKNTVCYVFPIMKGNSHICGTDRRWWILEPVYTKNGNGKGARAGVRPGHERESVDTSWGCPDGQMRKCLGGVGAGPAA